MKELLLASIWAATPVDDMPRLKLTSWRVMQTDAGSKHLVGWNVDEHEGRASSAVVSIDPSTRTAVTESGRVYELAGMSGHNLDAEHVWAAWCRINNVKQVVDVTADVEAAFAAPSPETRRDT